MSDKTDAWMPLWIGAYLADTMKLTTMQHGAYLLMLMAYWRDEEPLPDDDSELRSITKADKAEWKKLRPVMARFFKIENGKWWHKRVEEELCKARAFKEKQKANGLKGGRPKKSQEKPNENPDTNPNESSTHTPSPSISVVESGLTHTGSISEQGASASLTAGAVCKRIIELGISPTTCNPGHPDLTALLTAGASMAEFEGAARLCADKGKGFPYLLGIVKGQREQAAKLVLHQGAMPGVVDKDQAREGARARLFGGEHAAA